MGVRRMVDSPLSVDFSGMPVPPLKFFLQTGHQPSGILEHPTGGVVLSHQPWYTEITLEIQEVDAQAILYVLSADDSSALMVACLDEIVEPMYQLMAGPDFGDELTQMVAIRWPEQYAMFLHSNGRTPSSRMMVNIATASRRQWAVADELRGNHLDQWSIERALGLVSAATETFVRMSDPAEALPELTSLLGGPNRLARRLGTAVDILDSLTDVAGVLAGTSSPLELLGVARDAKGIATNLRRDWT